ncbi:hypothetical protein [Alteribacillus iranensis]|uniref:hypothetical protein n=1 Tax=Alteribacillus iranensis TaxID=930128 RepID=UPI000B86D357|nr:hypothetical protein [Alteribacillus iranensis]
MNSYDQQLYGSIAQSVEQRASQHRISSELSATHISSKYKQEEEQTEELVTESNRSTVIYVNTLKWLDSSVGRAED